MVLSLYECANLKNSTNRVVNFSRLNISENIENAAKFAHIATKLV
jgi:hypothetical protein